MLRSYSNIFSRSGDSGPPQSGIFLSLRVSGIAPTRQGCYRTYSRMAATIAAFPATIETPRSYRSACTTPPASCTINSPAQTSHSCSASSQ